MRPRPPGRTAERARTITSEAEPADAQADSDGTPEPSTEPPPLLAAPLLVFAGYAFGQPMDLLFSPFEVMAVALSVGIVSLVSLDGESNWMEGVQLLAVYVILGLAFYFLPEAVPQSAPH